MGRVFNRLSHVFSHVLIVSMKKSKITTLSYSLLKNQGPSQKNLYVLQPFTKLVDSGKLFKD